MLRIRKPYLVYFYMKAMNPVLQYYSITKDLRIGANLHALCE
jgi:hypothetical protein